MATPPPQIYDSFLSSRSAKQWQKIGAERRAGVATPLFSIYSKKSCGIGELPDLKLLMDWCKSVGLSILQLLPMNDMGYDFRPYDAQSAFALEPAYLSLAHLILPGRKKYASEIKELQQQFPTGKGKVDYLIKSAKMDLLWSIFCEISAEKYPTNFKKFQEANRYWLPDYATFRLIKSKTHEKKWSEWEAPLKQKNAEAIWEFHQKFPQEFLFYQWLQWQLYEQFKSVKAYAAAQKVLLMGDIPFLVSRDSADVWAHQNYFKLDLSSGAPPDMYFATGQRWGMPTYNWPEISAHGYDYLSEKLKFAENFYDLYRIDHVVGTFRLWSIAASEPPESRGLNGWFEPREENTWEEHGRKLLSVMLDSTVMLPCAEDLGTVPPCSYRVLEDFAIPGMDVQRWARDWGKSYDFKAPREYRKNSVATLSTHDSSSFLGWWKFEAGTVDGELFRRKCQEKNIPFEEIKERLFDFEKSHHGRLRWRPEINSVEVLLGILKRSQEEVWHLVDLYWGSYAEKEKFWNFLFNSASPSPLSSPPGRGRGQGEGESNSQLLRQAHLRAAETSSVFSIQLLQDWLSLDPEWHQDPWTFRINFPGTMSDANWSLTLPFALEDFQNLAINADIRSIHEQTSRGNL